MKVHNIEGPKAPLQALNKEREVLTVIKNDRDYQVGDLLIVESVESPHIVCVFEIKRIYSHDEYTYNEKYCIVSLKNLRKEE